MNLFGQSVGLLGQGIGPMQDIYLQRTKQTEKRGHTSMPRVGLEPTILVFKRPKTVRASDRAAIGNGATAHYFLSPPPEY